jgi:hypothetical protein
MESFPWFLTLVGLGLTIYLIVSAQLGINQTRTTIEIQGARLQVSLNEIFGVLTRTSGLGPIQAIYEGEKKLWDSDQKSPPLGASYYDVKDYTIIVDTPLELNIESVTFLENSTRNKLKTLFQRDVFIRFTDRYGKEINGPWLVATRTIVIIVIVFILLAFLLTLHRILFGSWQK